MSSHALRFQGTQFWVRHRRRDYGPFDYEWSRDLGGMELLYRGEKFGEYCSPDEIYADLKSEALPRAVVDVGSVVLGCIIYGILHGLDATSRWDFIRHRLAESGYERFANIVH